MPAEGHTRAFMAHLAGILADLDRYLAVGQPGLARDGARYRMLEELWRTDAGFAEFLRDCASVIHSRMVNTPNARLYVRSPGAG
jgi:hypothetical protein